MVPDVSTGSSTLGLINYLFGKGRRDEHTDPHIVAAWDMAGAPDPGRDPTATYTKLARRLDHHVDLRTRELGGRQPPQHVWHCPVRTAPGDRYLTDAEWAEVARRVVAATGIAPEGDDKACRWIAVRHADDHIHIMATTVRADGRRPRTNRDGWRAQLECRKIEAEFGLRRLKSGDLTAPRTPTGAERAKAERQGREETAREWLREQAYGVAAAVRSIDEYFTVLRSLGIQVRPRVGPETGEVTGYSLAAPGDTANGEPVWYGGSKLAPDLSCNRLRERLPTQELVDRPQPVADPAEPWHRTKTAIRHAHAVLDSGGDAVAQGHLDAFGDTLHNLALASHGPHRAELQAAAKVFNRARRSAIRADHQAATALREAAKELAYATHDPGGLAIALIFAALHLSRAAAKWHEQRGHEQQAAAAEQAFRHLQAGYQEAAAPVLADLTRRAPRSATISRFEQDLRTALPGQADRILADPAWPALTTTLARAETAGHNPRRLLAEVAAVRELETAERPAEVLNWRITVQPNRRAQAARKRSSTPGASSRPLALQPSATTPASRPEERGRHR
ncbi:MULTISPECIES: mobilization protein [unclassified Streptomyces]|uniref:relaxase/mobilization nuclease domain-containing protein n=1 Tax=unclassified Streptomyces TaxID=2593676 RepID=UPI00137005EC|nr:MULTISPECIES: mobilization protein [unclassified Streptomyces]NEA02645.1 mobilization protein [Streptomyces sp. SID10116]MYY82720.1 mobilization protein [Streptomyces sp. SID335]MYZ14883.1 mobilization protein [Streptomyces sp. SID337]NDZ85445.1 mobilization protein [Streptomyces sp. SID10115]NEB44775.1 mobilization protein [Streptomyces sp. SID339]